jgi:hypothetical protein
LAGATGPSTPTTTTPTAYSGNQDNLNGPQTSDIWYASSTLAINITGLTAGSYDGKQVLFVNTGSYAITLVNQSTNSSTNNRFRTATGSDVVVNVNGAATLLYQTGTVNAWRVL